MLRLKAYLFRGSGLCGKHKSNIAYDLKLQNSPSLREGQVAAGLLRDSVVLRSAQWCSRMNLQRTSRERGC